MQSACFSPDGSVLIVGLVTGRWIAMIAETREHLSAHTDGSEPIQVVKFSPSGNFLALGSRDNNIYIYEVSEDFTKFDRVGRCSVSPLDVFKISSSQKTNDVAFKLLSFLHLGTF